MRGGEPDPLGTDIVYMGEDRGDGASLARRFGLPDRRVKIFDENLVDTIVGGKNPCGGSAGLRLNTGLSCGHGAPLLDS